MDTSLKKYILIDVVPKTVSKEEAIKNLEETLSLIGTFGGGKVVEVIQRRENPHPGTYIGSGKAQEVGKLIDRYGVDTVILNGGATSAQIYKLQKLYWDINPDIEVWDRVDLILKIFEKHATTVQSKLQIQLAKLQHMGPRMYGLSQELGRQGGGIGTRGSGETNIELMKRHWRDSILNIERKLKDIQNKQESQIQRRKKYGFKTVSIIGYTNSGKTTLFNYISRKGHLGKDALFATLDSAISSVYIPKLNQKILISDTIGFIQNLPPKLIKAFKSTLLESINADLLLHVIDMSDKKMEEKIEVVENIISELNIDNKNCIYVGNKIDLIDEKKLIEKINFFSGKKMIWISSKTGENIEKLKNLIADNL